MTLSGVSSTDNVAVAAEWLVTSAAFGVVINDSLTKSECKSSSAVRSEEKSDRFLIKVWPSLISCAWFVRDEN
jgi:hypothetical protein